jgi:hypothetical protein
VSDNTTYKGQFLNGKKHGIGEQVWPDGSCFMGSFKDGVSSGKGVQIFSTGDYYIGDWKNGMSDGFGEYYHEKDNILYEGEWLKGEQHGFGKEKYSDASFYEGKINHLLAFLISFNR